MKRLAVLVAIVWLLVAVWNRLERSTQEWLMHAPREAAGAVVSRSAHGIDTVVRGFAEKNGRDSAPTVDSNEKEGAADTSACRRRAESTHGR